MAESLPPLPDSLRNLVDAEKACPDPQSEVADKVYARLGVTLGLAATIASASVADAATTVLRPATRLSLLGHAPYRTLATFLLGASVGAGTYGAASHYHASRAARARSAVMAAPPSPAPMAAPVAPVQVPAPGAVALPPVAPRPVAVSPTVPSRDENLAAERNLIEMARTALARGRAESALLTLRRHSRQFPHGQLSEERESLLIQALVATNDVNQARERAATFRRRYPGSLFAPAIDRALQSLQGSQSSP